MSNTLTLQQLQRGLAISEEIAALQAEMSSIFNGSSPASETTKSPSPTIDARTGKRSAKTIAKMKASQQARWAKIKSTKVEAPAAQAPVSKKKGGMSAEGRARIVAAQKARWALFKKAKAPAANAKASKAPAKQKPWYAV